VLALVMNVNAVAIGQALYEDEPVRHAVVAQALSSDGCPAGTTPEDCLEEQKGVLRDLGVPVGWDLGTAATECRAYNNGDACWLSWLPFGWSVAFENGVGRALLALLGWLFTAVAVSFGAPFWFDSLSKLGSLRTAGRRPGENAPYESTPKDGAGAP
jgi:hypothetical protein